MTSGGRCMGRDGRVRLFGAEGNCSSVVCFHYLDLVMISELYTCVKVNCILYLNYIQFTL